MPPLDLPDAAIARIDVAPGTPVGAAFAVQRKAVLTCAHVVGAALGMAGIAREAPDTPVGITFKAAPEQSCLTQVSLWDVTNDIAGLTLQDDLPEGVKPLSLFSEPSEVGTAARTFGFPGNYSDGVWVRGEIVGQDMRGFWQFEASNVVGYSPMRGFSGAVVWDDGRGCFVGMVAKVEGHPSTYVAYAQPMAAIVRACGNWLQITEVRQRVVKQFSHPQLRQFETSLRQKESHWQSEWLQPPEMSSSYTVAYFEQHADFIRSVLARAEQIYDRLLSPQSSTLQTTSDIGKLLTAVAREVSILEKCLPHISDYTSPIVVQGKLDRIRRVIGQLRAAMASSSSTKLIRNNASDQLYNLVVALQQLRTSMDRIVSQVRSDYGQRM